MNTAKISDSNLARQTLKNLPWLPVALSLIALGMLILTEADSTQAVFAFELGGSSLKSQLAFDTSAPLKGFAIPVLTSFFVHENPSHLFSNLPWLIIAGIALQKYCSIGWIIAVLLVGHSTALLGAVAAHHLASAPPLALGMSGGVFALLFTWLFYRFKFWSWAALLTVVFLLHATHLALLLSHAPALFSGWLCGNLLLRSKIKSA